MPILSNAKKALRSSRKKTAVNDRVRARVRTTTKSVKKSGAVESLAQAFSSIDKAVKRHLLHRNKAARLKSQLSKAATKGEAKAAPKKQSAAKPAKSTKTAKSSKPASKTSKTKKK
jgi:small subunit ribosomal protein S20